MVFRMVRIPLRMVRMVEIGLNMIKTVHHSKARMVTKIDKQSPRLKIMPKSEREKIVKL